MRGFCYEGLTLAEWVENARFAILALSGIFGLWRRVARTTGLVELENLGRRNIKGKRPCDMLLSMSKS